MSGTPKNSSDTAKEAHKGGKHAHHRNKHPSRPCPNPPAAPTGVVFSFKVREKKTHLEYSGKIKWNGVEEDEQGHKIPGGGVSIDHYEGKYWPTDAAGVALDNEDGDARVRRFHKQSVKGLKVIDAEIISSSVAEFTTKKNHNFVVGERVRVQDIKPTGYNGRLTVMSTGLTATKFRADVGVAPPKKLEDEGTVEGEPDPNYNIVIEHIPNPKKWWWKAKIRVWDNKQCPSDWTEVGPFKPIQEARPQPPAPGFVSLNFDRQGGKKHNAFRGKVKISPVGFWDIPGFDSEDDVARYRVKVQVSPDGLTNWSKHAMLHVRDSDDEKDEDANILLVFHNVRRRNYYRVLLASEDRFNRVGNYAGPFPSSVGVGVGGTPDPVNNVTVTKPAPRRLVARWDEPNQPEDIDYYKIEWWRRNPLTLMETNRSRNRNDVYRVPEADKGKAHFPKVYAVDEDDNQSTPTQPGDENETGDFASGADVPGTVKKHAGPNTPAGWLRCNGDGYLTTLYPALFAEIGYTWNVDFPVGGATFEVPDFRKRHPKGVGSTDALGENDGVAEADRSDSHGDHKPHKHKHHHRNRRKDHSDDGGGDSQGNATPHDHYISIGTDASPATVPRGSAASDAAGPAHVHNVTGFTNTGGQHAHGVPQSTRRTPGSPFVGGFGQTAHVAHEDSFVEPGAGQFDVYQDSLVGGFRSADGQSWDGGATDSSGNPTTVNEIGAPSGHKKHGHLKIHFIIKT
jgi:microcystin-dependent protein